MRYGLNILGLISILSVCGCIPVLNTAADTVLQVSHQDRLPGEPVTMGLRESACGQQDDCLVIVGTGTFPGEHETWVYWHPLFMVQHPFPDYRRMVRVMCRPTPQADGMQDCRVQLLLQYDWPQGNHHELLIPYESNARLRVSPAHRKSTVELSHLTLTRADGKPGIVIVSGRIGGKHDPSDHRFMDRWFSESWNKAVNPTTRPAATTRTSK